MDKHTYPGMIYVGGHTMYVSGPGLRHPNAYVPAAMVDTLVDALIACRDNYGNINGGLVNDPNAPGELITKINAALEKAGVKQ